MIKLKSLLVEDNEFRDPDYKVKIPDPKPNEVWYHCQEDTKYLPKDVIFFAEIPLPDVYGDIVVSSNIHPHKIGKYKDLMDIVKKVGAKKSDISHFYKHVSGVEYSDHDLLYIPSVRKYFMSKGFDFFTDWDYQNEYFRVLIVLNPSIVKVIGIENEYDKS